MTCVVRDDLYPRLLFTLFHVHTYSHCFTPAVCAALRGVIASRVETRGLRPIIHTDAIRLEAGGPYGRTSMWSSEGFTTLCRSVAWASSALCSSLFTEGSACTTPAPLYTRREVSNTAKSDLRFSVDSQPDVVARHHSATMSTASLPSYSPPSPLPRTPSYTAEPLSDERRLTQGRLPIRRVRPPVADVVKQNKSGTISLRLTQAQRIEGDNPVYGARGPVEGTVELTRTDGVVYVAAKVRLVLSGLMVNT